MAQERNRRIVRRAVMAMAVVVALPVWYVAAWLTVSRAVHNEIISPYGRYAYPLIVFVPLRDYSGSDRPGSQQLFNLWWAINPIERRGEKRLLMQSFELAPRDEQTGMSMTPEYRRFNR